MTNHNGDVGKMSDELKPCPFCGGEATESTNGTGDGFVDAWIECESDKCDVNPHCSDSNRRAAIKLWNNRVTNDALVAQVELMKEALQEASDYLDTNKETSICSGSKLHTKFKDILEGIGDE